MLKVPNQKTLYPSKGIADDIAAQLNGDPGDDWSYFTVVKQIEGKMYYGVEVRDSTGYVLGYL